MKYLKRNQICILLITTLCFGLMLINTSEASDKSPPRDENKLTGKITDSYTGVPLAGVTVQIKGTEIKAETGKDGTYSLDLPKGAKSIILTYTGYQTLEIKIRDRKVINSVMTPAGNSNPIWG